MDIRQLTTFCEVVLTGSVSEAARNLGRTQPAVSHLLAKLEGDLGMPLFERKNGRVHPVPESEYLFRQASRILRELGDIETTMRRLRDAESGQLRVASMPGPAICFLPTLISHHLGSRADVNVTLLARSSESVRRLIESQQIDIGLADHMADQTMETVANRRTFRFRLVCAVSASHPLAGDRVVPLENLSGEPLAMLFREHPTSLAVRAAFERAGMVFAPRFEGQVCLDLLTYVLEGQACALVDPITAEYWQRIYRDPDAIVFLPLTPRLDFDVDLLTPKARAASCLAQEFETTISAALSEIERRNTDHGLAGQARRRPQIAQQA